MAYTATDFAKDLALYTSGAVIGVTRSRKSAAYAAKKGIQLAGLTASRAAVPVARGAGQLALAGARRYPVPAAILAGYGAYRGGAFDEQEEELRRRAFEAEQAAMMSFDYLQNPAVPAVAIKVAKRKASKYNQAIKMGMKALKASGSNGSKGKIKDPKSAMKTVSRIASKVSKGKKVSSKGLTGTIKRAVSRVLPKKKPVRRKTSKKSLNIKVRKY